MSEFNVGPDAQAAMVKALHDGLAEWMRANRAEYLQVMVQAVGDRRSGWIRSYHDNRPHDNVVPAELFEMMVALRGALAEPGRGAFTYAKFVMDGGSFRMSMRVDPGREPQLDPPYTAQDCARELQLFPRDDLRTPAWLSSLGRSREKVTRVKRLDDQVLDHYRPLVPEAIGSLWSRFGTGYLDDGLVRLVDPAHAVDKLQRAAPVGDDMVPVFTTVLCDVIYWRAGRFVQYDYRHGTTGELGSDAEQLLNLLHEDDFRNRVLGAEMYRQAVCRYGIPDPDDCFGYVPILGTGGVEDVNRLDPCEMWTHLSFIVQACGSPRES